MTESHDQPEFAGEVSQLLTAVVMGDATEAQVGRLNELLLHDESLRHQAARFLEEEAVLRREFEMLDRVVEFHNPLVNDGCVATSRTNATTAICETRTRNDRRRLLFAAAAVLICALVGTIWFERSSRHLAVNHSAHDAHPTPPRHGTPLAASMLSRVTYVSWAGPRFASELSDESLTASMQVGVIPFTSAFGRPAKGYMVCLQPGSFLDLVVAADAEGENSLAVIEFDPNGRPTGRRLTFSNSAGQDKRARDDSSKFLPLTKKGRLGIWTERNDTAVPRYYLFTAVHKLLNRSVDDSWHVSRLMTFVEEADLVHVGWDDSGMLSSGEQDRIHIPDDDFDDVSATIRIRNPSIDRSQHAGAYVYSKTAADDTDSAPLTPSDSDGYAFSVSPGEVAIVKVCSRSGVPVELALLENDTSRLQWRCQKMGSSSPTLGVCAIENNTPQPQKYVLIAQIKTPDAAAGSDGLALRQMSHTVLFDKEELVTVGFDDGKKVSDFDRVKVDILTMGDL